MKKKYQRSLFIFRRDLRIEDNTGWNAALMESEEVIPCFIFTPEQIEDNPYRSDACLQFMIESLEDLQKAFEKIGGRLFLFYGHPEKIVEKLLRTYKIQKVYVNRDYTPYSQQRDENISYVCQSHGREYAAYDDLLLQPPENTLKKDGKPYQIFTPYFKKVSRLEVNKPHTVHSGLYFKKDISFDEGSKIFDTILSKRHSNLKVKGGRIEGLKILKHLSAFKSYGIERDFPFQNGTTHLSAYLKFTVVSPREVYEALVSQLTVHHELIRSLYWRDFFSDIAYFFPHVFQGAFKQKYNKIKWSENEEHFEKWCRGETGFPIVDAGMREMNATGFMQNRVRMITGSFLTKHLHLNWQWGEKYFAQKLIDYDPAVNNGNWQWVASTGCDAQPYFRIFNPWSQQKKFDADCHYIKQWIPELKGMDSRSIHNWEKTHSLFKNVYFPPMLDHQTESLKAIAMYRNLN